MPYLTPDTNPADTICRVLFIPNSSEWIAIVAGALEQLTYERNFEQYGAVTPQECVTRFVTMFDMFSYNEGACRMIGELIWWAGNASPDSRWLVADGTSLLRADYPDLFNVIGTIYGAADGAHFNLPDLRGRVSIAAGQGAGLSNYNVGDTGGEETHTLTVQETAAHTHSDAGHSHSESAAIAAVGAAITGVPVPSAVPGISVTGTGFANIGNTGGNNAHNNIQPYLTFLCLIVAKQ